MQDLYELCDTTQIYKLFQASENWIQELMNREIANIVGVDAQTPLGPPKNGHEGFLDTSVSTCAKDTS